MQKKWMMSDLIKRDDVLNSNYRYDYGGFYSLEPSQSKVSLRFSGGILLSILFCM